MMNKQIELNGFYFSELYSLIGLLILSIPDIILAISCPSLQILYPCNCNETSGQFVCGYTLTNGLMLKQIFQESSRQLHGELIFNKFIFQNSIVEQIESDTLDKFQFRELTVSRNDYLSLIDENAFQSTYNISDKVIFESNPSLGSTTKSSENFFKVLSKFKNASLIHAVDCGLQSIPDNAFQPLLGVQSRLQRLSFAKNKITSIGDFAFSNLPKLNFLDLKHNSIESLGKLSLTLSESSDHTIIDLSKNRLTSSSFNSESLLSIDRGFDLILSDNKITHLNESIFKPLFKKSVVIKLWRNPINCSNCDMKWTSNEKYCEYSNLTISYAQRIEFECKLFRENFRLCHNKSNDQYYDIPLMCPLKSNSSVIVKHYIIILIIMFLLI